MKTVTIDELIRSKKCLDILYDGVHSELTDNIYVDTQNYNRVEIECLTSAIVQVFYAWLRQKNINIETDNL